MRVLLIVLLCALPVAAQERTPRGTATWKHLQERYDADGDGRVTAEEYGRGQRGFENLDRDGDGVVTARDFRQRGGRGRPSAKPEDAARRAALAQRLADYLGPVINRDGKPGLARGEWDRFVKALRFDEQGHLVVASLEAELGADRQARMGGMAGRFLVQALDHDGDRAVRREDLEGLFTTLDHDDSGVLEQGAEITLPPGVGEMAPDFELPLLSQPEQTVKLSSFRAQRPVVLIFGSYT